MAGAGAGRLATIYNSFPYGSLNSASPNGVERNALLDEARFILPPRLYPTNKHYREKRNILDKLPNISSAIRQYKTRRADDTRRNLESVIGQWKAAHERFAKIDANAAAEAAAIGNMMANGPPPKPWHPRQAAKADPRFYTHANRGPGGFKPIVGPRPNANAVGNTRRGRRMHNRRTRRRQN
jgi:hypothetical protein